jgi:ubiquitin carboxyl-terminal hydrolase 7
LFTALPRILVVDTRLQEVPKEEVEADDSDKIIGVFHFSKDLTRTHGVPFKFVVKRVCHI